MPLAVVVPAGGSTAIHWVQGNHLGTPVAVTDASGAVVTPSGYSLAGFPGQVRQHAELYYNYYRDYDVSLGRYVQADPIGLAGGVNAYVYANNNPLKYLDHDGHNPLLIPAAGALFWAGADYLWQRLWEDKSHDCVDWKSVLTSGAIGFAGGAVGRIGGVAGRGLEFSHFVPGRYFRPLTLSGKNATPEFKPWLEHMLPRGFDASRWNGNYVKPSFHALTDPYRNLKGGKMADTLAAPLRHILRIPTVYAYPASGVAAGMNTVN